MEKLQELKDHFLQFDKFVPLKVEDWPENKYVIRRLSAKETDAVRNLLGDSEAPTATKAAYWIACTLCHTDTNESVFDPFNEEHIAYLENEVPDHALSDATFEIWKVNGIIVTEESEKN